MKKISIKKIGLIIKNNYIINRSIPIILFIATLILGCLIGAMPISDIESRYSYRISMNYEVYESYKSTMEYTYGDLIGADSVFSVFYIAAAFVLAFLSVVSLNGFMRDKSGNDFYHSLSVNRGEIFLANTITAFINSALSIIVSQFAGILLMNFIADYKPMSLAELISEQLPIILTVLFFLALFVAIAMISTTAAGSVFASLINYVCINFYIPATILAISVSGEQLFGSNLMDYLQHFPGAYAYTSPFIRYIYSAAGYHVLTPVSYVLIALATLLLIGFGIWFYIKKKNENAFKPLPYSRMTRPLQYLIAFDAILLGATFFEAITGSVIWCIIGGILALFFTFIIFNAFADKSFHGVFKRARHMLFIFIGTLIIGAIFVADIFGIYPIPVPDYENIDYAHISISYEYADRSEWKSYAFSTDKEEQKYGSILITEDNAKDLAELYKLLNENNNNRYYISESKSENKYHISISMTIRCTGDFSSYHTYVYAGSGDKDWDKMEQILKMLQINYSPLDESVYYYEIEEEEVPASVEYDTDPTIDITDEFYEEAEIILE